MNNYQSITASPEALAAFLGTIPAIETPWDDAFHRLYCSSCSAADCDDCRRPERDSPLKSLVTLLLSGVFAYLAITGQTSQEFMTVYTVVIAFYFGTQTQKISDAVDKTLKGE